MSYYICKRCGIKVDYDETVCGTPEDLLCEDCYSETNDPEGGKIMNITDIKKIIKVDGEDKLDVIFAVQKKLKEKYDCIERMKGIYVPVMPLDINECRTQYFLKDMFFRIITELVEASECLRNKPWKQSEVLVDHDHLKEEISDSVHFLIELCICLGISSEEFFQLYFKKSEVNKWRQLTQY